MQLFSQLQSILFCIVLQNYTYIITQKHTFTSARYSSPIYLFKHTSIDATALPFSAFVSVIFRIFILEKNTNHFLKKSIQILLKVIVLKIRFLNN
jgi:hypothetical protein